MALDVYISPEGSDQQSGSHDAPFKTLAHAQHMLRTSGVLGKEPVTVTLREGVYYLEETLRFLPEDSGSDVAPVRFTAHEGEQVVISGGMRLKPDWQPHGDGIYKTATHEGLEIDQMFVNGKRQHMARYPNLDPQKTTEPYQGCAADVFSKERAAGWAHPEGGYIHAMHQHLWGGYHYRITGRNSKGELTYEGGWQNNRQMGMHDDFRMVENIFEELDVPGEWYHDEADRLLYYMPEPGTDLSSCEVEVVRLNHLIAFEGTEEEPVRHITLEDLTFRHAARTFMETKEPLLRSDWTIYRGGAVLLTGTEDITLRNSTFDQVGGNAVFVNTYNRRACIKSCHILEPGASGVCFVGDTDAVRNPLFEYGETHDLTEIDRTPGPRSNAYPMACVVEDCLIHGIGEVERQAAGIQVSMSRRITVRDCSVYDCSRAGININEGTWGGHVIEGCDVFDTVLETGDHGSFNSWGRDRYWISKHRKISGPEIQKDPSLPYLDAMEPTIIRNSRWRCDHGWDIDLDDGSTHYEITQNLMLSGGLKLREGFGRKATNNVVINNGLHAHVWFKDSDDCFSRNIVMQRHKPISQPEGWGALTDSNLFVFQEDLATSRECGGERNSVAGDPQFVNPEAGDFRVREGSPAFEIGFQNFPMDQFGVTSPALRALAKTPEIPALRQAGSSSSDGSSAEPFEWKGLVLRALEGEEFSAYGVAKDEAGLLVVKNAAAEHNGLKELNADDVIQRIDGQVPTGPEDAVRMLKQTDPEVHLVTLVRYQKQWEVRLQVQES